MPATSRTQRVVARYPYLWLFVTGFVVMITPVIISINLLGFAQFIAKDRPTATWIDTAVLRLLQACVSSLAKVIGWTAFTAGYLVMNAGVILHVRHRRQFTAKVSPESSEAPKQNAAQIEVAKQSDNIAESERDRP